MSSGDVPSGTEDEGTKTSPAPFGERHQVFDEAPALHVPEDKETYEVGVVIDSVRMHTLRVVWGDERCPGATFVPRECMTIALLEMSKVIGSKAIERCE